MAGPSVSESAGACADRTRLATSFSLAGHKGTLARRIWQQPRAGGVPLARHFERLT